MIGSKMLRQWGCVEPMSTLFAAYARRRNTPMSSQRNRVIAALVILPIIIVVIIAVLSRVAGPSSARTTATATPNTGKTTHHLFVTSATENSENGPPNLVTFPLFKGTSNGQTVYYVVTESSDQSDAMKRGVNFAPK